jgi:pimeloyl-ACP methyl ester carboxylesterase
MADLVANGVRHHVQRLGEGGRPVVLVHGLVMDNLSSLYFTLANPIARKREVILYDLRGHGLSERPPRGYGVADLVADLDGVLAGCGVTGKVALVGNSFGGLLALAWAAAHPERAERVALIDALLGAAGWGESMARTLGLAGEERDRMIAERFKSWLGRHSERKRTRLADAASALVEKTSLVADLRASPPLTDDALGRVQCPVLALYGDQSDQREDARRLARVLPRCTLHERAGCTHSILWEDTAWVRDQITAWVA